MSQQTRGSGQRQAHPDHRRYQKRVTNLPLKMTLNAPQTCFAMDLNCRGIRIRLLHPDVTGSLCPAGGRRSMELRKVSLLGCLLFHSAMFGTRTGMLFGSQLLANPEARIGIDARFTKDALPELATLRGPPTPRSLAAGAFRVLKRGATASLRYQARGEAPHRWAQRQSGRAGDRRKEFR